MQSYVGLGVQGYSNLEFHKYTKRCVRAMGLLRPQMDYVSRDERKQEVRLIMEGPAAVVEADPEEQVPGPKEEVADVPARVRREELEAMVRTYPEESTTHPRADQQALVVDEITGHDQLTSSASTSSLGKRKIADVADVGQPMPKTQRLSDDCE